MRVYISGPMRGMLQFNFEAFHKVEKLWRDKGHTPISPAAIDMALGFDPAGSTAQVTTESVSTALLRDMVLIIMSCDAVAVLPGWQHSFGSKAEVSLALACGKPVYDAFCGRKLVIVSEWDHCYDTFVEPAW